MRAPAPAPSPGSPRPRLRSCPRKSAAASILLVRHRGCFGEIDVQQCHKLITQHRVSNMDATTIEPRAQQIEPSRGKLALWRAAERLLSFEILMLLLEGGIRYFDVQPYVFPAPSSIAVALWNGVTSGTYLHALSVTLSEVLAGFAIGSACGILLGIAMVQLPVLDR